MTTADTDTRPDGTDPSASVDQTPVATPETTVEVTTPEGVRAAAAGELTTVASHLHPAVSWDVADHPQPTGREEVWRFTPLKAFAPLLDEATEGGTIGWDAELPSGVTAGPISTDEARALAVEPPADRVAALAFAKAKGHLLVDVPADAELDQPVVVTLTGAGETCFGHVVVRVGQFSRATVVFRHQGSATYAVKTDVIVGDGAQLNLVSLQDWDDDAVHGGQTSVRVGRDASVRTVQGSLGGKAVRIVERADYAGPGGSLEQFGVYFVDEGQHIEHRLFVDHDAPLTKSNVDYRGALQGKGAHSVWVGDVLIRKVAEGIETYEANKNLLLTEGCQADSVPNLEIETGEIAGAGHSSSTGRFDDDQLFYLMSRGIAESEARRLVVHGFFVDIIRRIGVESIEQRLLEALEKELAQVSGQEAK